MNKMKIMCHKVLLVISCFFYTFLGKAQNQDDCQILNYLIQSYGINFQKRELLFDYNSNLHLFKKFEELKDLEIKGDLKGLDSLKHRIKYNENLFTSDDFTQIENKKSQWSESGCDLIISAQKNINAKTYRNYIVITKPIYMKEGRFALVDVSVNMNFYYIILYKDETLGWVEIESYWYGFS